MITNKTLNSILDDICLFISEILKPSYFVDLNIFKNPDIIEKFAFKCRFNVCPDYITIKNTDHFDNVNNQIKYLKNSLIELNKIKGELYLKDVLKNIDVKSKFEIYGNYADFSNLSEEDFIKLSKKFDYIYRIDGITRIKFKNETI